MNSSHLHLTLSYFYLVEDYYLTVAQVEQFLQTSYPEINRREALQIVQKLTRDGYLTVESQEGSKWKTNKPDDVKKSVRDGYFISFEGILFWESGGYENHAIRERLKEQQNDAKVALEEEQTRSVIETNRNVRRTNNFQRLLIGAATAFSALTLIFTYLDYKKDSVINLPPPQVVIQQSPPLLTQDSSTRNTSRNQRPSRR